MKAMLERAIAPKDTDAYNYTAGNISSYDWFTYHFIERGWIFLTNMEDYIFRDLLYITLEYLESEYGIKI